MAYRGLDMTNPHLRLALGLLTGLVGLVAMLRLVSGAFTESMSPFAWMFVALAMVPWVAYAGWRARHGQLTQRAGLLVLGLGVVGLVLAWLFTIGAVVALACSLAAFVIIWIHDWPSRRPAAQERIVPIDELASDPQEGQNA